MDKIYTAKEVSEILNCSLTFVYDHADELGAVRLGTLLRFPESRLRELFYGNMEKREQMVLPVQMEIASDQLEKGVRHSGGGKTRTGKKKDRALQDENDPFGLHRSLRASIERFTIPKGKILPIR